jgi:hypothetical protein
MTNNNVIYAYKKVDTQKIVYVGQTTQLEVRHRQHIHYDPFNLNNREYDYPLSRGVRKYGENAYELIILEDNLKEEDLNEREKYWIKYYNTYWQGYNQTIGGSYPTKPIYEDSIIETVIEMLKDESFSYSDILEKTGLSYTHIYNINIGARRKQKGIIYPIRSSNSKGTRGIKFSQEEVLQIHEELKNSSISINNLAKKFNCCAETISKINKGTREIYRLEGWSYPIRDNSNMSRKI